MALIKYKRGGQGLLTMLKKRTIFWGWKPVEIVTNRRYEVENEIISLSNSLKDLVHTHERLVAAEKSILSKIDNSRQLDSNESDPEEVLFLPKDSIKYLKVRGEPDRALWLPYARLIRSLHGSGVPESVTMRGSTVSTNLTIDRVGVTDQPVGVPTQGSNNNNNRKTNQQNKGGNNNNN